VVSAAHAAAIDLNGDARTAILRIGNQSLLVELALPGDAKLEVLPRHRWRLRQPQGSSRQQGIRKLAVHSGGLSQDGDRTPTETAVAVKCLTLGTRDFVPEYCRSLAHVTISPGGRADPPQDFWVAGACAVCLSLADSSA